jgi:hypothetical protein
MLIENSTMENENIISHNDEIFPFLVSLSNYERAVHPSTGSGRTVKSLFSKQSFSKSKYFVRVTLG